MKDIPVVLGQIGEDFIIQEKVVCHESIERIYKNSVNTFRIITYRWYNQSKGYVLYHMPVILRIGQGGSYLDNAHAGGMFVAVDDDGTLHETAFTEFNKKITIHPDSGFVFHGNKVTLLPSVIETAKLLHAAIPQIGCINWDFTIGRDGSPLLIEANCSAGGIWMLQMSHGCGPFGELTPEVLKWLRHMKNIPATERYNYMFGCR